MALIRLQNDFGKNVNAQYKVKTAKLTRGMFVTYSHADESVIAATNTAAVSGILDRDVIVTRDVAMGYPVSMYDAEQDACNVGDYVGVVKPTSGERYATTEFVAVDGTTITAADYAVGTQLDVANGKLTKKGASSTSKIYSLGLMMVAGKQVLGFTFAEAHV